MSSHGSDATAAQLISTPAIVATLDGNEAAAYVAHFCGYWKVVSNGSRTP